MTSKHHRHLFHHIAFRWNNDGKSSHEVFHEEGGKNNKSKWVRDARELGGVFLLDIRIGIGLGCYCRVVSISCGWFDGALARRCLLRRSSSLGR
jgi:hypothetical protein